MPEPVCNKTSNRKYNDAYQRCNSCRTCGFLGCRDQSCGTLFCSGGWDFPVTSKKSYYTVGNGVICNEATMNPEDNYPADLGMVPTGTKCGHNMVRKLLISPLAVSISKPLWRPASSYCISGVLQSTVSRHQKYKNVRNEQLLCQMQ